MRYHFPFVLLLAFALLLNGPVGVCLFAANGESEGTSGYDNGLPGSQPFDCPSIRVVDGAGLCIGLDSASSDHPRDRHRVSFGRSAGSSSGSSGLSASRTLQSQHVRLQI